MIFEHGPTGIRVSVRLHKTVKNFKDNYGIVHEIVTKTELRTDAEQDCIAHTYDGEDISVIQINNELLNRVY